MTKVKETFLTEKQLQVLKLLKQGHSQAEIGRKLNVHRSSVNQVVKKAKENLEKSRNTLKFIKENDLEETL